MKKKVFAKTTRQIARATANMDGKYKGLTQKEVETAMAHFVLIEAACILGGYRSLTLQLRKAAVKKAKSFKNKNL